MKYKLIAIALMISLATIKATAQCKNRCSFKITNSKTKKVVSGIYNVEVKSGWDMWVYTGDATYKTQQNQTTVFAIVYMPNGTWVVKGHKATGPSLVWSGASPSINCDVFPWGGFNITDVDGNKGIIKIASY